MRGKGIERRTLFDGEEVLWLTAPRALEELQDLLSEEIGGEARALLEGYQDHLRQRLGAEG